MAIPKTETAPLRRPKVAAAALLAKANEFTANLATSVEFLRKTAALPI